MNLDLYHAQIGEGNLIQLVRDSASAASVRCRWPTYPAGASRAPARSATRRSPAALDETGYDGVVGLEAWASGDSTAALEAFRTAFTLGG